MQRSIDPESVVRWKPIVVIVALMACFFAYEGLSEEKCVPLEVTFYTKDAAKILVGGTETICYDNSMRYLYFQLFSGEALSGFVEMEYKVAIMMIGTRYFISEVYDNKEKIAREINSNVELVNLKHGLQGLTPRFSGASFTFPSEIEFALQNRKM